jgi:hypothetical protein
MCTRSGNVLAGCTLEEPFIVKLPNQKDAIGKARGTEEE